MRREDSRVVESLARREHPRMPAYLRRLFQGVELSDARLLDVGAGNGITAFYAAAMGAREVVGLEPQAKGASAGSQEAFAANAQALPHLNVRLDARRLQEFSLSSGTAPFDVAFMHHAVNHLDEPACEVLHKEEWARCSYEEIFRHLRSLVRRGGMLIAADCSRRNLFGDLGIRNPLVPDIEWHKHQSPFVWLDLLGDSGWEPVGVRWTLPSVLGDLGQRALANRLSAYLSTSHFVLYARAARLHGDSGPSGTAREPHAVTRGKDLEAAVLS